MLPVSSAVLDDSDDSVGEARRAGFPELGKHFRHLASGGTSFASACEVNAQIPKCRPHLVVQSVGGMAQEALATACSLPARRLTL